MYEYETTELTTTADTGLGMGFWAFYWVYILVMLVAGWKVFAKAGQPGWGVLVPFYNLYLITKMAGRSGWWVLLLLIPIVNWVTGLIVAIDIAKAFGKSTAFGVVALWLFTAIGVLILAFGKATYTAPNHTTPKADKPAEPTAA